MTRSGSSEAELRRHRRALVAGWRVEPGSQLERFGALVQRVVDDAVAAHPADDAVAAALDDLVDITVPARFGLVKRLVMRSPPLIEEGVVAEDESDLNCFAPAFRAGEGRFRHFAVNAAAATLAPDALVAVAARLMGGDLPWLAPPGSDSAADLATNRVGRAFAAFLTSRPPASLAGGDAVRDWVIAAFGAPTDPPPDADAPIV